MNRLEELKRTWGWEGNPTLSNNDEIRTFELLNKKVLPPDMREYFKTINGTNGYDDDLFCFFSLADFKPINEIFTKLNRTADLDSLKKGIENLDSVYIFAEHHFHLFSYGINLFEQESNRNDIYIFCGNSFHIIANNFSDFIELCLKDSEKIYFS